MKPVVDPTVRTAWTNTISTMPVIGVRSARRIIRKLHFVLYATLAAAQRVAPSTTSTVRNTSVTDVGDSMKHCCTVKFAKRTIVSDVLQITRCMLESTNATGVENILLS